MAEISLAPLHKALGTLKDGWKEKPSDLERDGLIQRFEYCFELCWKSSRRVLNANDIDVDSPKAIFRELGRLEWIHSSEAWLQFFNARNQVSHIYNPNVASEVFSNIQSFIEESEKLTKVLEQKVK